MALELQPVPDSNKDQGLGLVPPGLATPLTLPAWNALFQAGAPADQATTQSLVSGDAASRYKHIRMPTPADNASAGYSSASLWNHAGRIYGPVTAPSSASCVWGFRQRKTHTVDQFGSAVKFAGGTVQMVAGYVGPAIDISVTINSVATAATINILANGAFDKTTIDYYLSRADVGTYCTVTKVYDQSGGGNHITKDASYAALFIDWDTEFGEYAIVSDYINGGVDRRLRIPSTLTVARNNFHMLFYGRVYNSAGDSDSNAIAVLGDFQGGANQISPLQFINNGGMQIPQNPTGGARAPALTVPVTSNPGVFGVVGGTTNTDFYGAFTSSSVATNRTDTLTGGWIGSDGAGQRKFVGRVVGISVGSALTATQVSAMVEGATVRFGLLPQALDQLLLLGDSRFAGAFQILGNTFSTQLPAHLKNKCKVINFSWGGKQISDLITSTAVAAAGIYKSGVKNVACILAGVNNFIVGGKTVAASVAEMTTLVSNLKTAGFKVVVVCELATTSTTNNANTLLPQLAAALLANPMGADRVVDMSGYTDVQNPSNTALYPDGLHPRSELANLICGAVAPHIDAMLA